MYASLVANLNLIFDFSFIKIICFLYFNAHQNCLNKSIWLFLENANLGCYKYHGKSHVSFLHIKIKCKGSRNATLHFLDLLSRPAVAALARVKRALIQCTKLKVHHPAGRRPSP